jgi:hypothetical protein
MNKIYYYLAGKELKIEIYLPCLFNRWTPRMGYLFKEHDVDDPYYHFDVIVPDET